MRAALAALVALAAVLAGCAGSTPDPGAGGSLEGPPALAAGMGAISGLVIDDIYRPVSGALILLQGPGLTATSDADGEFTFVDVSPGSHILIASAAGHEAAPVNVDVTAGIYEEVEVVARRIFSNDGTILTAQFSAFIPCAADFVVNAVVANCVADLSGDSYRAGFTTENTTHIRDITYLVSEAKMNKVGSYTLQVRHDNGEPGGGERYAVGFIEEGDYIKMVNQFDVANTEHNEQQNNVPWKGEKDFATIVFYNGQLRDEAGSVPDPADQVCCGVGADFGIKAKFVQSIFIGEPAAPVENYCVLC